MLQEATKEAMKAAEDEIVKLEEVLERGFVSKYESFENYAIDPVFEE